MNQTELPKKEANYKKKYGTMGETLAVDYLEQQGYQIEQRNFYCRQGEIDIIARDQDYLCFIEVKHRKSNLYGYPSEALVPAKIRRICKAALVYLHYQSIPSNQAVRFDVVSILDNDVTLIKNAFSYLGYSI